MLFGCPAYVDACAKYADLSPGGADVPTPWATAQFLAQSTGQVAALCALSHKRSASEEKS